MGSIDFVVLLPPLLPLPLNLLRFDNDDDDNDDDDDTLDVDVEEVILEESTNDEEVLFNMLYGV
jgi:hypothetical protein